MKKLVFLALICLLALPVYPLNLSRVKTWGTEVLTALDLNAEFDNILNHSISNADVAASAGIVASKLDLTVGSNFGTTTPAVGAFTTLSSTGNTSLGNGADTLTINASSGITFTPAATWTFSDEQTVSGTWADLGIATTIDINGGTIDGITDLKVVDGGTEASTFTDGGVLLGSGTSAITAMSVLGNGAIIIGDGTTDPVALSAFSSSTGSLKAANGGTGLATITDGAVMLGSGTGAVTPLAVTTDGAIIVGDGTTDPTTLNAFSSATGTLKVANGGTGTTGDGAIKAWINFNGTGTIAIRDHYNVTSITDNGTADYTITWDTDFANTNYCVVVATGDSSGAGVARTGGAVSYATGSTQVKSRDPDGGATDSSFMNVIAIGDQ